MFIAWQCDLARGYMRQELSAAFWSVFADQGTWSAVGGVSVCLPDVSCWLEGDRDWLGMRDYYSFVRAVRDGCLSASVEQPTAECLG